MNDKKSLKMNDRKSVKMNDKKSLKMNDKMLWLMIHLPEEEAFGDREKQNLGVGWSTYKQKDNWSKMGVQEKAWSSPHLNKEEC